MEKKQQVSLLTFFSKSPKVPTPKSKTNTPKNSINNNDDSTGDQNGKSKPNEGVNPNGSSPELKSKTASSKKIDTNAAKKSSKTASNGDRVPGDVVWARLEGYPWWPSMICVDPNSKGAVYSRLGKIHVQFFDSTSSHAWVCS